MNVHVPILDLFDSNKFFVRNKGYTEILGYTEFLSVRMSRGTGSLREASCMGSLARENFRLCFSSLTAPGSLRMTGDGTATLRCHPSNAKVWHAV